MDLSIYKIDLDTDQPNGGKGESPRSAFTKYNNSLDTINGELTTLGENVDTINGELTTLDGSAMKKADNLSDLTDAATARSNLGLGSAATKDVVISNYDTSGGDKLVTQGWAGIGAPIQKTNVNPDEEWGGISHVRMGSLSPQAIAGTIPFAALVSFNTSNTTVATQLQAYIDELYVRGKSTPWRKIYHTGNTTVDANGFIKAASPIIKLFSDSIEKTEHLEIANTELERMGVGHYVLRNAPLLSRDGWYIETPKDRNNNIYFYLDYEEDEDTNTLTIKTYEPDYSSGRAEAGEPVDILEGRFVSLRFEEDASLYVEQKISND